MSNLIVLGAGKIGATIATFMSAAGDYRVTLADAAASAFEHLAPEGFATKEVDVTDPEVLEAALAEQDIVVSACPYYLNAAIARAARATGTHYFDLTEDVETTREVRQVAEGADVAFMPQCGLAPGFIGIAGHEIATRFDKLDSLHMRVGALPQFPSNALKYNLTWSTDGVINEYCNPCEAIYEGARREVLPLEGYELFSLDGMEYEAFNTSGGLGTLCETLEGKIRMLDYKSARYPGHRELIKVLANELRLSQHRRLFRDILERAVPMTLQDVVVIFVTASGWRDGRFHQESLAKKVYGQELHGKLWSAIQLTTAAGLAAVVDLHRAGKLPAKGFLRQEEVVLGDFLENRFGQYYA